MDLPTLEELKTLRLQTQRPSISIYLPTYRAGRDTLQNPIRFKNQLREAERQLIDSGMGQRDVETLLAPAQQLLDDGDFWQHQYDGLAVFVAADDFHTYKLPYAVEETLTIAPSYHMTPMLPMFTGNGHYYILAVSQNEVRLFQGTRYSVSPVEIPNDAAGSMAEVLRFDDPQAQLQARTGGSGDAVYHGHGEGDEVRKERIEGYLNIVDKNLQEIFMRHHSPVLLAGVEYLLPIYRKVTNYDRVLDVEITGNPEQLSAEDLHEKAWPIMEPYFQQEIDGFQAQYHEMASGDLGSDNLAEVVAAAHYGRVDRLMVASDVQRWGQFDADTGTLRSVSDEQGDQDMALLDFAAIETLNNSGTVYAVPMADMPTDSPVVATFRYPMTEVS